MKATIITPHHENSGQEFRVVEVLHNRVVCLHIDGRKVDFGMSEVRLAPDASLGAKALTEFTEYGDSVLRDNAILRIARRAAQAWGLRVKDCNRAIHMDAFLGHVLEDFKAGIIAKAEAIGGLAHVMAALDLGNYDEARLWFEQGRKFIQQGK